MQIIGKYAFICAFMFSLVNAKCDVHFDFLNSSGDRIEKVSVGVPFQLHVIAKGDCDIKKVILNGCDDFGPQSLGTMQSISNINGNVSKAVTYRYRLRIDQVGKYELGPIEVLSQDGVLSLDKKSLEVVEVSGDQVDEYPSAKLKTSKKEVFVGEQFLLNMKLFFKSGQVSSVNVDIPRDFKNKFEIDKFDEPNRSSEMHDGVEVNFLEWQIPVAAKTSGDFIVPAIPLLLEKLANQNLLAFFNSYEKDYLFTNSEKIKVKELPYTDQTVQGIGSFSGFVATTDRNEISDGHGATLRLSLKGAGNWPKINISNLDVPEGLEIYESKNYLSRDGKTFEFAVQGISEGKHVIPSQSFFYFDVNGAEYKTISTNPIEINVLSVADESEDIDETVEDESNTTADDTFIKPIFVNFNGHDSAALILPFWLFLLLAIAPFIIFIILAVKKTILNYQRTGFKGFQHELNILKKNNDATKLYGFFIKIFRQEFESYDLDQVFQKLTKLNVSELDQNKIKQFLDQIMVFAFASDLREDDLFAKADYWLRFLEGVKNGKK